jgi:hypothetical protein
MGLSRAFVDNHIAHWEARLHAQAHYPYRRMWPSRLFHHTPIENAARILSTGQLLSRTDSAADRALDVADPAVVNARGRAHNFGRMYFRPRTPTQFHIEGIRRPEEYYHGVTHCPTIVMMIFDARSVLTTDGVRFSRANMQSPGTRDGDTEEFFRSIDFERVFHEGPNGGDATITSIRCAEVLTPSPFEVADHIQWIYCRSQAERSYLLDILGRSAARWQQKILVSDDIRVFEKRFTYVDRVAIDENGVLLSLAPRSDGQDVRAEVEVNTRRGRRLIHYGPAPLTPFPPYAQKLWRIHGALEPGNYVVTVQLEGCCAFRGTLLLEELPF